MANKTKWFRVVSTLGVLLMFIVPTVVSAGSNSTNLPNGAELTVSIDDPLTCTEFIVPAADPDDQIDVNVEGAASVGLGEPDATIVYVIDESGSTGSGSGTGCSPILQCEKNFFLALNAAAIADGSTDLAGVVHFETGSNIQQTLVAPTSSAIPAAINAASASGRTNCAAGLNNATTLVTSGANTNGTSIVVFASDGLCNEGGSVATAANTLGATGAIVHSVAIGSNSDCTSNGGTGTLNQIPKNGGTCTEVPDPGNLPNIIQNLIGSTLESLQIEVDSGGKTTIANADIDPDLPQAGAVSVDYDTSVTGLDPDDHEICVTANGSDVTGGVASVTQCEEIHLLQLTATPATESNELGEDNSHTVTGEIVGGSGPARDIVFAVAEGGTNSATPSGDTKNTAVNTPVDFDYSVPKNCHSLGTDTITVSTVIAMMPDSINVTKEWVDTTPPEATCVETVNPHGNKVPPAGSTTLPGPKGGQNEDGFYELLAEDPGMDTSVLGCELQLYIRDTGSGTVFGPFSVGDKIKYTEDAFATPESRKMGSDKGQAGTIAAHIIGNGDPVLFAVDVSGNTSADVYCLVPQPPK